MQPQHHSGSKARAGAEDGDKEEGELSSEGEFGGGDVLADGASGVNKIAASAAAVSLTEFLEHQNSFMRI